MDFRSFVNTSLNQHVIVAAPLIPQWKPGIKQYIVKKGNPELFLLAITASGQAAYCPLTGGAFFSVGKVVTSDVKGAVLVVTLRKNTTFMGGIFSILDILFYDSLNVLQMPHPQRFSFANYIQRNIVFPSRYSIEPARKISSTVYVDDSAYDAFGIS
jgi:hypothetical protein